MILMYSMWSSMAMCTFFLAMLWAEAFCCIGQVNSMTFAGHMIVTLIMGRVGIKDLLNRTRKRQENTPSIHQHYHNSFGIQRRMRWNQLHQIWNESGSAWIKCEIPELLQRKVMQLKWLRSQRPSGMIFQWSCWFESLHWWTIGQW